MNLLLPLVALGAGLAYVFRDKIPGLGPKAGEPVSSLKQNQIYAVIAMVGPGGGTTDPTTMAGQLKASFDQMGFTTISVPQPRTAQDSANFKSGAASSAWIFTAKWNMPYSTIQATPPAWITNASFTPVSS